MVGLPALYEAMLDVVARHDLDALAIAVTDPESGEQVFAVGDPRAMVVAHCQARESAWAALPPPPEELPELATLRSLALTGLRLGTVDPDGDPLTTREIEIRRLPGISAVTRHGEILQVAVAPDHQDEVLAHLASSGGALMPIVVVDTGPAAQTGPDVVAVGAGTPTARVELVTVRTEPERGELEVHLRYGERRTVGRGPLGRAGAAAADATLDALRELGEADGYRAAWVRTVDTLPDRQFLVAVSLTRPGGTPVYGIAPGSSPIEAAARATLGACNRTIGRQAPTA
jgi:hypothetical protein